MKRIEINSTVEDRVPYHQIKIIQGDLKDLHQDDILKFEKNVIEHGFVDPIDVWVDEHGHYGTAGALCSLGGTQRLRLLQYVEQKGYAVPDVPINRIKAKTYKEAGKILLSLASTYGKITPGGLAEFAYNTGLEFGDLKDGFSLPDIDLDSVEKEFTQDHTDRTEIEDEVPEAPKDPISKLGDLYELGEHRLLCGDSTDKATVERLMNGEKADMVFTDPPYGINEEGDRSGRGGITRGNNLKSFKDDSIEYAVKAFNICADIPTQYWFGANYYCHSLPQTNNWLIWDKRLEEKQTDNNSDAELAWVKSDANSVRIFRHLWKGLIKGSEHNQKRVHPTQKPIALPEFVINKHEAKSVLDLFGGSGSTLIACEKTKRKCYMMELDPHYIDVIVSRWCKYTNQTKIKKNGKNIEWTLDETST